MTRENARENFIVVVKSDRADGAGAAAQTFVNAYASGSTLPNASTSIARKLVAGDYIDLGALDSAGASIRPVTVTTNRKTVDIECNTNAVFVADVIYTVESSSVKKEPGPRTKTLVSGNGSHIVATTGSPAVPTDSVAGGQFYFQTPNQTATSTDSIPVSDAFNLVKVVDSGQPFIHVTTAMMTATANNITDRYTFESGQKDNFYDHATIKLKPGQPGPVSYTHLTLPTICSV